MSGQAIESDTLTIYETFVVCGRSPEWMEDQLNIWSPDLLNIREDSGEASSGKDFSIFKCHDIKFRHKNKEVRHADHLFFDLFVKCMPDSCTICMTNIDVICNHRPVKYIHYLSTGDDHLNRSNAWLRKNKELADSARIYSLSLFYKLKESLERQLNRPEDVKLRRVKQPSFVLYQPPTGGYFCAVIQRHNGQKLNPKTKAAGRKPAGRFHLRRIQDSNLWGR